ncbi:MAG: hypothetical protein KAI43_02685 [Candidatus Aureabacteria bacterium]|nr:hypothetical protein [Candidatus Auribacterota bacterium]
MKRQKKIIFISSKQNELQSERDQLRDLVNINDEVLSKLFIAKTFEIDLSGRRETVNHLTEEWVLKSDIYFGVFDKEYSEPTVREYEIAIKDKQVKKEIIIFIKKRKTIEREDELVIFMNKIMNSESGHACIIFDTIENLLYKAKHVLIEYCHRKNEGFIISKEILGENLELAKNTHFPEKLRRQLLQPIGRFAIWKGRKGIPEYYKYDWNGTKIDVTWNYIEPNASKEVKEFYYKRYNKPFDS